MPVLPQIASLWLGPRLTFLEQVCLKSFYNLGHRVVLFSYEKIENMPDGIESGDANDILPLGNISRNKDNGSPASYSDKFRYHMLSKEDYVWVDTDACCIRPFPAEPYYYAKYFKQSVNNSVLRLPKSSRTLAHLIDFVSSDYPDLPEGLYNSRPKLLHYRERRRAGEAVHISELDHETWGPHALTFFLTQTGEMQYAMETSVLNPISAYDIGKTIRPLARVQLDLPQECHSVHLYGTRIRQILRKFGGRPLATSFLDTLCKKHGIDPSQAPIS